MLTPRCAVLGSPISHSLSPVLHRTAYAELGLDWRYEAIEVGEGQLADFLADLDESWRGLSLTMPLKVEALALADEVSTSAKLIGAANTLVIHHGRRTASNTDAPGLADALRMHSVTAIDTAVILGGGATARSALAGLAQLGVRDVAVALRTSSRLADLARLGDSLGVDVRAVAWDSAEFPDADVYVSTVTAGAADEFAEAVAEHAQVVFDVIYDPWPTRLAQVAQNAGRQVLGGLELLVGQAVLQVMAMTGQRVPAEVLLRAGREALASGQR